MKRILTEVERIFDQEYALVARKREVAGEQLVREKDETTVAVAKTGMVCFDYSTRKITALPEEVQARLAG